MREESLELATERLKKSGKTNLLDGATEKQISEFEKGNQIMLVEFGE